MKTIIIKKTVDMSVSLELTDAEYAKLQIGEFDYAEAASEFGTDEWEWNATKIDWQDED